VSADDHLRRWLAQGMTGCQFAARIARERHRILSFVVPTVADEADVSGFFDACREARLPAIAMFTGIRSEAALVEQLARLIEGERWRIAEVSPDGVETDDVFVAVDWRVREGLVSSVMGFAPFASMPVTRRAPYVCIAAWPGEHDNPHWTKFEKGIVHFLDTDLGGLGLTKAKYQALTKASVDATTELLKDPADDARYYRRAAFRLSPSARALLLPVFAR
jgi:hypothetical protein